MAPPANSQWDFGELFPREPVRKVLSVSDLTGQIRRLLEKQIGLVWVSGEIANLRSQSSGHIYFTVKDSSSQLSCVLFRGEMLVDRSLLQDGRHVLLQGDVTVYEPRGQYQLRVVAAELQGVGALQAAFEKLKAKLYAEGLFARERKRPLPRYPRRIGLVTSPTGAAIRDVLHVIKRRDPGLEIILAPCRVQGEGAAEEIAAAIRHLNEFNFQASVLQVSDAIDTELRLGLPEETTPPARAAKALDLILVTRGGGSLEDLWAFNEEVVARAIFESALPIMSGVGHEIDFTISDFVADVRAATPSAAAEIITEGVFASCEFLSQASGRLRQLVNQQIQDKLYVLDQLSQRLTRQAPRRRLNDWLQRLDDLRSSLLRCAVQGLRNERLKCQNLSDRLSRVRPGQILQQRRDHLEQIDHRLQDLAHHHFRELNLRLTSIQAHLRLLGPEHVLSRGYSITMDAETGKILREAAQTKPNQRLRTRLKTGEVWSSVEENKDEL